ncbi:hydrogenase nickel incorporation protein HypB [Acidihalobacter prosperus]
MCTVCGCEKPGYKSDQSSKVKTYPNNSRFHYGQGTAKAHVPGMTQARIIRIERDILGKNAEYAQANRTRFQRQGILALNLVSSPGSGKTTLLVNTVNKLKIKMPVGVIEGDQQTSHDADKIRKTGVSALQVNTGKGCHLDAQMIENSLDYFPHLNQGVLFIENVGNLVCPAGFDLGEAHKVVILSTTEGEDKPLKYPDMFHAADLLIINKMDLLPYVNFNIERCIEYAYQINPDIDVIKLTGTDKQGLKEWTDWIESKRQVILSNQPNILDCDIAITRDMSKT